MGAVATLVILETNQNLVKYSKGPGGTARRCGRTSPLPPGMPSLQDKALLVNFLNCDSESATEALRAFRSFKDIRSGKGPMSCYSLKRLIKISEETGSLKAKPRSGRPSTCKSVAVTVLQNAEAIETLSTYGELFVLGYGNNKCCPHILTLFFSACGRTSRKNLKFILAESPQSAVQVPERPSVQSQPGDKLSPKERIEKNSSKEFSMEFQRNADPPARETHASPAAARDDVTAPLIAASCSASTANPAPLIWGDSELAEMDDNDAFTVVRTKKRRRDSPVLPAMAAQPNSAGPAARRQRSSPAFIPRVQEIRTTRTHIAEARARQASCTEEQCFYLEYCPDFQTYQYLRAILRVVGGPTGIVQMTKMNGHYLIGLANKSLAERLIREGLEVEGTLLKTFPFRKRSFRITIGNLPFFVKDAAVIDALSRYGRITSIAPKQLRVGEFDFTDGRREAFILLHDGITLDKLPTRFEVKINGEPWPAFLSHGIKCSRCNGQGHRRANCPQLHGRPTTARRASPPPSTGLPPSTAPGLPRQSSAAPPAPAPPSPALGPSGAQPDAQAVSPLSTAPRPTTPAPPASSVHVAAPAPPPEAPAPEHPAGPRSATTEPTPPARPDFTAPCGPLPAQGTLGPATHTPDVDMTTTVEPSAPSPAAVSTPPLPAPQPAGPIPPAPDEEEMTPIMREECMVIEIFKKLKHLTCLRPLYQSGIQPNDLKDAILFIDERESLMARLTPAMRGVLAEFLSAAIEPARGNHPDVSSDLANRAATRRASSAFFASGECMDPGGTPSMIRAESPSKAEKKPVRHGAQALQCAEIPAKQDLQSKTISQTYANPPSGDWNANLAAARGGVTTGSAAATSSNGAARVLGNWADYSEDQGPGEDDDFTVVRNKRRRRDSPGSPAAAAPSSGTRGAGATRRPRSSTVWAPRAEEVRTTRAHIAEARARQASSTEDHCVFVERSPELEPYHYLRAIDRMFGSTREVFQVTKMNGHFLVGLANRGMAERLVNEGLEVEGTLHRAFPFRKRAERITVGNLPFFVGDAAVPRPGTSPGQLPPACRANQRSWTDHTYLSHQRPISDCAWPASAAIRPASTFGVSQSNLGALSDVPPASRAALLPPAAPRPPPPAPLALPVEDTSPAPPPVIPAPSLRAPGGSVSPQSSNSEPSARDIEMTAIEESSASSTSSSRTSMRDELVAFIQRSPTVSFTGTDALGLGREEVLDLLSSRTKAQRKRGLLTPPQTDALAGLIKQILGLKPAGNTNVYKILHQVKSELKKGPAAVPPTPPLPATRPAEPTPPAPHGVETKPAMATPPPPLPTPMEEEHVDHEDLMEDLFDELNSNTELKPLLDSGFSTPELEPYHYMRAMDRMFGSTREVFQVTKMNGHFLVVLANRGMAERLVNEGLEVEGTLHRAFPFRKRAERITVGNLPFFVGDAAVISALTPLGRVTSIAPKLMKAGPYIYNDGRREAFMILREGMTIEGLPTRLNITIKGEAWPAYLSSGIRCSRCRGQGHRRANCPLLAGRTNAPGPATPTSPTSVPSATAPGLPQQPSAQPPPSASPSPTMELSDVPPASRAALLPPAAPRPPPPAPLALPVEDTSPAPPPVIPAPSLRAPGGCVSPQSTKSGPPAQDIEMTAIEESSASSTSSSRTSMRDDFVAFIRRSPTVSFTGTDALGLGREEVLDLLSSRTKAQRKRWLLTPPQTDALAGLIKQILGLKPAGNTNVYKILHQVKSELKKGPAAVPPTPPLPAPWPAEPAPPAPQERESTPAMATRCDELRLLTIQLMKELNLWPQLDSLYPDLVEA
ncbi:hypothetical protein LAZ67_1003615, partial [Cordylochernes scorpioides]